LLATFEPREALLVDLRNMQEPGGSFHDLSDLMAVFVSRAGEKLHRLRKRFVALGQPFKSLINRHFSPPLKPHNTCN
jgi:hypothetical protein